MSKNIFRRFDVNLVKSFVARARRMANSEIAVPKEDFEELRAMKKKIEDENLWPDLKFKNWLGKPITSSYVVEAVEEIANVRAARNKAAEEVGGYHVELCNNDLFVLRDVLERETKNVDNFLQNKMSQKKSLSQPRKLSLLVVNQK
jgi:hypothetical protein